MSKRVTLVCVIMSLLLANGVLARDSLWRTASEMATCEAYDRLQESLEHLELQCQTPVPHFHKALIEQDWLRLAGLSACYVGPLHHFLPIGAEYDCSLFTDGSEFHEVVCTRDYPEDQVTFEQSTLSEWQTSLMAAATMLKSCRGAPLELSFAGPSLVPSILWDHYQHDLGVALSEIGVALSEKSFLLYLGTGTSKPCGSPRGGDKTEMGVVSFAIGMDGTVSEDPMFLETRVEIHNGLHQVERRMRDLADLQRRFGSEIQIPSLPRGLSVEIGSVEFTASPDIESDNFAMLSAFREIDFMDIFEWALLEVELGLELEELFFDFSVYLEELAPLHPMMRMLECRFPDAQIPDRTKEAVLETRVFVGSGLAGCERGHVLLSGFQIVDPNGRSAEFVFFLLGEYCRDLSQVRQSFTRLFSDSIVNELLFELDLE